MKLLRSNAFFGLLAVFLQFAIGEGVVHANPAEDFAKLKNIFGDLPLTTKNVGERQYSDQTFLKEVTFKFPWEGDSFDGHTGQFTPLSFLVSFAGYETILEIVKEFKAVAQRDRQEIHNFYDVLARGVEFRKAWDLFGLILNQNLDISVFFVRRMVHTLLKNENLFILNRMYSDETTAIQQDKDTNTELYLLQPKLSKVVVQNWENICKDIAEMVISSKGNAAAEQESRRVLKVFISFYTSKKLLGIFGRDTEAAWHIQYDTAKDFQMFSDKYFRNNATYLMSIFNSVFEEIKANVQRIDKNQALSKATEEELKADSEIRESASRIQEENPLKRPREQSTLKKSVSFSEVTTVRTPQGKEFETATFGAEKEKSQKKRSKPEPGPEAPSAIIPASPTVLQEVRNQTPSSELMQLAWDQDQIKTCSQSGLLIFGKTDEDIVIKALESNCKVPDICRIDGKPYPTAWLMVKTGKLELFLKFLHSGVKSCGLDNKCEDLRSVREVVFEYLLNLGNIQTAVQLLTDACFHGTPNDLGRLHVMFIQAYLSGKVTEDLLFNYFNNLPAGKSFSLYDFNEGEKTRNRILTRLINDKSFARIKDLMSRNWFIHEKHVGKLASAIFTSAIQSGNNELANAMLESGKVPDLSLEVPVKK